MRPDDRIAGLAELSKRYERYAAARRANRERRQAFVDAGVEDGERAAELLVELEEILAERNAIADELRRLHPALTAGMN
jgi:hypothetical protein